MGARNTLGSKGDLSKVTDIKCQTTLYDLPYFEVTILKTLQIEVHSKGCNILGLVEVNFRV